jgi:hypothetical protein
VHLKGDDSFGMSLVNLFVFEGRDLLAIDPGFDPGTVGHNAKAVPLTVFEMTMGLSVRFRS